MVSNLGFHQLGVEEQGHEEALEEIMRV